MLLNALKSLVLVIMYPTYIAWLMPIGSPSGVARSATTQ